MAQSVRNPPAMQETQVQSLGQEDALEKEMATHFLQYSCLGNPMHRGAWWAIVEHDLATKPPPMKCKEIH